MKRLMTLTLASLIALAFAVVATIGGAAQPVSAAADPGLAPEAGVIPKSVEPKAPLNGEVAAARDCATRTVIVRWPVEVHDSSGYLLGWWIIRATQTREYCYPGPRITLISSSWSRTWQPNPVPPGA